MGIVANYLDHLTEAQRDRVIEAKEWTWDFVDADNPSCRCLVGHAEDYVERDEVGRWNFRPTDETSGLVYLDNGSVVRFAKDGRDLWFLSDRAREFMPTSEMDYGPAEFDLGRDTLGARIFLRLNRNSALRQLL